MLISVNVVTGFITQFVISDCQHIIDVELNFMLPESSCDGDLHLVSNNEQKYVQNCVVLKNCINIYFFKL